MFFCTMKQPHLSPLKSLLFERPKWNFSQFEHEISNEMSIKMNVTYDVALLFPLIQDQLKLKLIFDFILEFS